jgi:hypothetical protein
MRARPISIRVLVLNDLLPGDVRRRRRMRRWSWRCRRRPHRRRQAQAGERIYDRATLTWGHLRSGRTEVISFGSGVVISEDKGMGVALVLQIFQVGPGRHYPPPATSLTRVSALLASVTSYDVAGNICQALLPDRERRRWRRRGRGRRAAARDVVGSGRHCPPLHRMPRNSMNEGSECGGWRGG